MNESAAKQAPEALPQPVTMNEFVRTQFEADPVRFGEVSTPQDVETVALEVLDSIPEGRELMERIQAARRLNKEDTEAIRERGKLWRELAVEVSLITGVEIEAAEHEAQRDTYRQSLGNLLSTIDPTTSDEEVMLKLGMIRPVEGAKGNVFTFPSRIFPPYIKEQWKAYSGLISQFKDAELKLKGGVITQTDFDAINILRRKAHNTVSTSMGDILQFAGWDLEKYRKLVEKMADEKFAKPTGEMATYADLLREQVITPEHLTALHRTLKQHKSTEATEDSERAEA